VKVDAIAADQTTSPIRFPGWWVVAGCFIVLTTSSGLAFYGLAVYLNAFSNEQGWPLKTISLATTIFFIVGGVVGVGVARLIARYDVRYVLVAGGLIGGASLALLGQVEEQWQLFVVYGVFGIGFAAAGLVPATTVVTRWFHERRSVALSVASTGLSVGGILITPFAKRLIDDRGLAEATPWLGLVFVLGVVPFAWFMVRPDPGAEGWNPDGKRIVVGAAPDAPIGTYYERAVRTRFFVAVTIGYIFALGSQVGGIQQLVKLVEDRTDPSTAQFAITVLAATSVVSRLVGGRIVQLLPMMRFTVLLVALQCAALVMLGFAESTWLIFLAIILFGMTIGNILMLQPLLMAERFGVRDYPRIFSRSQLVAIVGTAGGPLLIGWLYDSAGSYRMPYTVAAVCSLVGVIILSLAGPATFVADD
jgi:MFS family permease